MLSHRPIRAVAHAVGKAECGSVVNQGIEPHIRHVLCIPRQLNAPRHPAFGPRNRQVANRLAEQGQHLVSVPSGTNKIRVVADVVAQPFAVLFHAKEVVALAATLRYAQMIRAFAVNQLLIGQKALAANAVQPLVLVVVDVPSRVNRLQYLEHNRLVPLLSGADKVVVGDIEHLPSVAEALADAVAKLLRVNASLASGLINFFPVLVGAGQEVGVESVEAVEARQKIGYHGGIGVADVGHVVDIVDRRGDVECFAHGASGVRPTPLAPLPERKGGTKVPFSALGRGRRRGRRNICY